MSFESLGLIEPLLRAVNERGYTTPSPVQLQAIPAVLSGADLLAGAQTGTGKTAGFTLPMLQLLSQRAPKRMPANGRSPVRALVLTPTRELAAQIEDSVKSYGKYLKLTSLVVFGGVNINPQMNALRGKVDILVATPGRLLDLVGQRMVDLSMVEILVLDEADRMLDMGFIHDIKKVLALLPKDRQNLLFSATFNDEIRTLADRLLNQPRMIDVARRNATADLVDQKVIFAEKGHKRAMLSHLVKSRDWSQVLVFTRTKHGANRLAEQLEKDGITALAIHGNKSQNARTRALAEFKGGTLRVLVATDIAARGLDIVDLPHVVNYELPNIAEDYVHRIGRTGRAGAVGVAISLVAADERPFLSGIERLVKQKLPVEQVQGFVPPPPPSAASLAATERAHQLGRGGSGGRSFGGGRGRSGGGGGGGARPGGGPARPAAPGGAARTSRRGGR